MKQFPYTKNGMRQILDSPVKAFNRRCVSLMTGNVLDPAYHSGYIRAWSNVKNGSYTGEPGQFRRFDYGTMRAPEHIRRFLDHYYPEHPALVLAHVYGRAWIAYECIRDVDTEAVRVLEYWPEPGTQKQDAFRAWITEALEWRE